MIFLQIDVIILFLYKKFSFVSLYSYADSFYAFYCLILTFCWRELILR